MGHNLDEPSEVPGMVVINKRGASKTSRSWDELLTSRAPASPRKSWISRYASATFNPLGREFADGGINEVGLCVNEMTLSDTRYPQDKTRPSMFMMLWIQYQLDNFESVDQVVANLNEFALDGWGWHFLVCDRQGNCAVIEFLGGQPMVYSGESLPVSALCNAPYAQEIEELGGYQGFGGACEVDLDDKEVPRFVHAAYMLKAYQEDAWPSAVGYAFEILNALERGRTKWSYVLDVRGVKVYFRSSVGQQMKHFALGAFDLSSRTPAQTMDVNADLSGEVSEQFVAYSSETNRDRIAEAFRSLEPSDDFLKVAGSAGSTLEQVVDNMAGYPEGTTCV